MAHHDRYWEEVALKYQLYNGMFLSLPFENVRRAGILLPLVHERARRLLPEGRSAVEVLNGFFEDQLGESNDADRLALLFRFVQLVERQVVLFDAIEDAAFRRVNDMDGAGTLSETMARIVQAERRGMLAKAVESFRVRVVLTAHPTQFYPGRILGVLTDLANAVAENDVPQIYDYLIQLGKTRFGNRSKPSPMDEARSLLWYLENVFYETWPRVHARVAVESQTRREDALRLPPIVQLGFWPGGDRDGNPFVDAHTTRNVVALLQRSLISLYLQDMEELRRRLTFDGAIERLNRINTRLRGTLQQHCEDPDLDPYGRYEELLDDLVELWHHLHQNHDGLFVGTVEDLLWKVQVFGFSFATLDLRQDSRVHRRAVGRLVEDQGDNDSAWPDRRFEHLEAMLSNGSLPSASHAVGTLSDDPVLLDTVASLQAARDVQALGGERALHRYIISNTRDAANVLEVLYLARVAGYPAGAVALDIVPLFETVDDLEHSEAVMRRLYESGLYRDHLRFRGDRQQIMLGFSDGTKDGGYVTANWLIYRARESMSRLASTYGVAVTFFEGRGGPPARGGGKTHQFYRGMNRASAGEEIHLTIQGQTISSNFGTRDSARYNLEQLVTAGLENRLLAEDYHELTDEQRDLLDKLSSVSLRRYRRLKEHPQFLPYLKEMTPLTLYGEANNASRPTSRGNSSELRLEDLRAIPFVGAWSQMKQNVPGYYGFGTALLALKEEGKEGHLQELFRNHLFFRTLVENSMQSISKVNLDVTRFIATDGRYGELWKDLEAELQSTHRGLLAVAAADQLLPNDSATRQSIELRESIVLPVLIIQQYALAELRRGDNEEARNRALRKLVVKSMAAIVNAGRNSV